jgi:hypothetical protein
MSIAGCDQKKCIDALAIRRQIGGRMPNLHVSPHTVEVATNVVEGAFVAGIAVLAAVTAATLIFAWFIA